MIFPVDFLQIRNVLIRTKIGLSENHEYLYETRETSSTMDLTQSISMFFDYSGY